MDELIKIGADAMRAHAREANIEHRLPPDEFEKFAQAAIRVWGWPVGVGNLLIELSGLLRGYEKHHRDKATAMAAVELKIDKIAMAERDRLVAESTGKAEANREWADKIDERIALLIDGPDDIWPVGAEFQRGDLVTTKRIPFYAGPVIGWYRTSLGRLGFVVESQEIEGLVHVYPETGLEAMPEGNDDDQG